MKYFYVIMPVGSDSNFPIKRTIIKECSEKFDLSPYFPLETRPREHFNINKTISEFNRAEFVLADLSLERPSCYYELGLAQAIGKNTIMIAEEGTSIHQADKRNLILFYKKIENYSELINDILNKVAKEKIL